MQQNYRAHMIASTGMNYRDSIRKKLVEILRRAAIEIDYDVKPKAEETLFGEPAKVKVV